MVARELSLHRGNGSCPCVKGLGGTRMKKFLASKAGGNILGIVLAIVLFFLIGFVFGIGGAIGGAIAGGVGFLLGSVISNACKEKELPSEPSESENETE